MSELSGSGTPSVSPFTGLVPSRVTEQRVTEQRATEQLVRGTEPSRGAKHRGEMPRISQWAGPGLTLSLAATMPVLLVGTMGVTAYDLSSPTQMHKGKSATADPTLPTINANTASATVATGQLETAAVVVPTTYTVRPGDTVSGIAAHYGLSTAAVLALNGLSWKSLIFPRQVLRLTKSTGPVVVTPPATTPPVSTPPVSTPPVSAPPVTTPPVSSTPTLPVTPSPSTAHYVIRSGDTITAIAKRFGVSIQSILTANHLVASSIIYTGRTLVIPGTTVTAPSGTGSGTTPAGVGGTSTIVPLSASMEANARTIISVGVSRGVPTYGLVIALAAAMQESSLQNLTYGDRDSVGLFQQRPSAGWGTVSQLETPAYAAELFFGGPKNPNKGKTRGLLDISGWQNMTLTQAAQAVQISGNPTAYAKWEASARAWVAQLT